jgi:hypothetical protein
MDVHEDDLLDSSHHVARNRTTIRFADKKVGWTIRTIRAVIAIKRSVSQLAPGDTSVIAPVSRGRRARNHDVDLFAQSTQEARAATTADTPGLTLGALRRSVDPPVGGGGGRGVDAELANTTPYDPECAGRAGLGSVDSGWQWDIRHLPSPSQATVQANLT